MAADELGSRVLNIFGMDEQKYLATRDHLLDLPSFTALSWKTCDSDFRLGELTFLAEVL